MLYAQGDVILTSAVCVASDRLVNVVATRPAELRSYSRTHVYYAIQEGDRPAQRVNHRSFRAVTTLIGYFHR